MCNGLLIQVSTLSSIFVPRENERPGQRIIRYTLNPFEISQVFSFSTKTIYYLESDTQLSLSDGKVTLCQGCEAIRKKIKADACIISQITLTMYDYKEKIGICYHYSQSKTPMILQFWISWGEIDRQWTLTQMNNTALHGLSEEFQNWCFKCKNKDTNVQISIEYTSLWNCFSVIQECLYDSFKLLHIWIAYF